MDMDKDHSTAQHITAQHSTPLCMIGGGREYNAMQFNQPRGHTVFLLEYMVWVVDVVGTEAAAGKERESCSSGACVCATTQQDQDTRDKQDYHLCN
mmetsp:Transcript_25810/g.28899  ORF Transcript_25810/g.28899 Transcript_25810/m.28899 type:complete len:96 (+) Transcript_25810:3-290(+)